MWFTSRRIPLVTAARSRPQCLGAITTHLTTLVRGAGVALLVLAFCACAVETQVDERMETAQKLGRYEFMFPAAPLRIEMGMGRH